MSSFHITIQPTSPNGAFGLSFEEVADGMQTIPRMFLELDGAFVWVLEQNGIRYQLDGLLLDDGHHVVACEVKGTCSENMFDTFLTQFGWPDVSVQFQLVQEGAVLTEQEFRNAYFSPDSA